ncbi:uncharacterized protein L969DRAFT_84147 [Mixia osmundae IAM 14324]|uniref:DNA-directed RNA polymerase subunit n=1 Tax=Mixia osmundae (strain CBS 9802 / IAM 14324 / JCM 22182 / KY 12970) TaxID=764103 RepID=G7EAE2_MIXOS|nr:uncharacterized protein L969DRAFT_84147 [Mixia osmundae IAM 14324]KEI42292.1 hypothetical protein L969DRAFT_84147 [Mixia osmundae IAM 14324]GAA99802.1 hypothetical protein E5Q_06505 [Mixia osmundae IAM 14324]
MIFCPTCANLLIVQTSEQSTNCFGCPTCPYLYPIKRKYYDPKPQKRKQVDDVLGGEDAWKNVDSMAVPCTKKDCNGTRAYYMQIQTRSADEPMTTFYRCTLCAHNWKE